VALTTSVETVGIVAGGSYWPHYLLQLTPMVALAVGVWGPQVRALRLLVPVAVLSAVVGSLLSPKTAFPSSAEPEHVGTWLKRAGHPGDTATVLYGEEGLLHAAGMTSPYEHLWTLPMRTLDPAGDELRSVLTGPRAPTWVVVWEDPNTFGLDPGARTRLTVTIHYHLVDRLCGHAIWLRDGLVRRLPPAPRC
jgi:hypothetical protein